MASIQGGPPRWSLRRLVLLAAVLTAVTLAVAPLAGRTPGCADGTVVDLELARTEERAVELIGACDTEGLDVLRTGLLVDSLAFVPLYVVSIALWCAIGSSRLTWSSSARRTAVVLGAVAAVVAGILDQLENRFLSTVVEAGGASGAAGPAFAASVGKWVLVAYALGAALVALVRSVRAAVGPGRAAA
jgi:hypothetical protein